MVWLCMVDRLAILLAIGVLALFCPLGGAPASSAPVEAFFVFDTPPDPAQFVFMLNQSEKINEARAILRGENGLKNQVTGIIVAEPVYYNAPWGYHLQPESVEFFEMAAEVCDATIVYVEEHLEQVGGTFLPGNRWCPWSSHLVREIRMR